MDHCFEESNRPNHRGRENTSIIGCDPKKYLFDNLIKIRKFRDFQQKIADELDVLSLSGWAYARLDIPIQLAASECIGTVSTDLSKIYDREGFGECDLIIKHVKESLKPIFKSDIDAYIKNAPFVTAEMKRYKDLSELNNEFDYKDSYCIPLGSTGCDSRALFAVNSSGMSERTFRDIVDNNSAKIKMIGQTVNDVGEINFPEIFIHNKKVFRKLVNSQPFNLLVTMVRNDLTLKQAANTLKITVSTAEKHIMNIRNSLGVKTTYGAYEKALSLGAVELKTDG